jgi:hypothetical protein
VSLGVILVFPFTQVFQDFALQLPLLDLGLPPRPNECDEGLAVLSDSLASIVRLSHHYLRTTPVESLPQLPSSGSAGPTLYEPVEKLGIAKERTHTSIN